MTVLQSNPYGQVSGVDGRTLMVSANERASSKDLVGVDIAGNVGILGTLSSASSRVMKKDITPYRDDPLASIREVQFIRFRYKAEPETSPLHVGFIAERTPIDFSGANHNAFSINNSLAINLAATKKLDSEVGQLRAEIRALKIQIGALRKSTTKVESTQAAK